MASSLAGIVGAAVEIDVEDAPEEASEVVQSARPPEEARELIEQAKSVALVVPEASVPAPELPVIDAVEPPPQAEPNLTASQPQVTEPETKAEPERTMKPKKKQKTSQADPEAREAPRQAKSASSRRGNAAQGSGGASAGGKGGSSRASAGAVNAYAARVRAQILARRPSGGGARGTTVIRFGLTTGGSLRYASVSRSSGDASLDSRALATVRGTSFPQPPLGTSAGQLNFTIPFHFH